MKQLIIPTLILIASSVFGQEYKIAKSTGRLEINEVNNLTIEGSTGNEIVFSSLDGSRERDPRAQGLRAVSANGLEDNTGIGLAVNDKGTTFEVYQLKKMDGPRVKILVPKGVTIVYRHTSPHGSEIKIRNVESELEISTVHNGVILDNVTGPANVRTVHGKVEVTFNDNVKGPLYLSSTHGLVDVALPAATKANITLSAEHGEIFLDPNLKIEIPKSGDFVKYGSSKVEGKLNGGGIEVTLTTSHGNVYLRKK
ncbi:MAG: DUF4097 family beta strand repeat-containing protein [Bacteroidota bacterium]